MFLSITSTLLLNAFWDSNSTTPQGSLLSYFGEGQEGSSVLEAGLNTQHIIKFLSFISQASHLQLPVSTSVKWKSYNPFRISRTINRRHKIIYKHIRFWDLMADYNSQVDLMWSYNIPNNIRMEHYDLRNSILFQKKKLYRLNLSMSSKKLCLGLAVLYIEGEFPKSLSVFQS